MTATKPEPWRRWRERSWGIDFEAQVVKTTRPGDSWKTHAATGQLRATVARVPVPLWLGRLALWLAVAGRVASRRGRRCR